MSRMVAGMGLGGIGWDGPYWLHQGLSPFGMDLNGLSPLLAVPGCESGLEMGLETRRESGREKGDVGLVSVPGSAAACCLLLPLFCMVRF